MALFTDLHDVAQIMAEHIRVQLGFTDVQPGDPQSVSASTTAAIRITLLYVTPQPQHRSDPAERAPDGRRVAPPLSLSCFYLVTAAGADASDPIAAHHALGQVMQLVHDMPELELPLSESLGGSPGADYSDLGSGRLTLVQPPVALEQIDKIWTSIEAQLQPWVMLEVAPVQLVSLRAAEPPAPVVRPGGLEFIDVRATARPVVVRITPQPARAGGRVRIDAAMRGALQALHVAGHAVPAGDGSISRPQDDGPILLSLDDAGLADLAEGAHPLSLQADGIVSRRATLHIAAVTAPSLDAPDVLRHDPDDDLVLSGANLTEAVEALLWPDAGIDAPSDIVSLAVTAAGPASVTVPASGAPMGLRDADFGDRLWRLVLRIGPHVYTPYVLLELRP